MERTVPLIPPSAYTVVFLGVMGVGVSVFLGYLYVDSIATPATEKTSARLQGLLMMLGLLALAFGGLWFALQRRVLILTDTELIFRTGFYGRTLARTSLRPECAVEVSLLERREFAPRWRTSGIGLPGYKAGWFRLRSNEKALVYLTDPFHVTYLPTGDGYVLLISTTALLRALRDSGSPLLPGQK